jgi:hypothetical protein
MSDTQYFDNYLDLFVSEGWKQFQEDNQSVLDTLDLKTAKNWDEHIEIKTEIEVRELISSFADGIRYMMEHGEEESIYEESL